ncbi:MAG: cob(I)yrinic acid a,c-diamide adenosyltransferase [Lachnospiraceae bacterium]|nr:cob(I)yrinic acid a,c-diamide adenosyltransferase [Lachnospiraceae bacterium]
MGQGAIVVYHGRGAGKSAAALGHAVRTASRGGTAYVIQFLKGQMSSGYIKRLEPECKFFRFERQPESFDEMTEVQRSEERKNIANGLSFARKVLATGECEVLVLDEVLGAVDEGIVPEDELLGALSQKPSDMTVILTGRQTTPGILEIADVVLNIQQEK